jgi:hypothetical protein
MLAAFGLYRLLAQQLFGRGKGIEELIVQIVAVGDHNHRRVVQRQYNLTGSVSLLIVWTLIRLIHLITMIPAEILDASESGQSYNPKNHGADIGLPRLSLP